tara:strand:- start:260 stop:787 length:528 start_codon:yes stop_codon:yes gene_type:complete
MSKVARKPVHIPENTKVSINNNEILVEGPLGKMSFIKENGISVSESDGKLSIKAENADLTAMSGTTRALINNIIFGVSEGWKKSLKLIGVGYRAISQGSNLELVVGYSHPVKYPIPEGIKIETPSQTEIIVSGIDKQKVGQVASDIRSVRPPEPYKGKGIRYTDEHVVKKEAKKK